MLRILLDECLPKTIKNDLIKYNVLTVPEAGWAGKKNGELLSLAELNFDIFITIDQNLVYQQKIIDKHIAVIVLSAATNRYLDLKQLIPEIEIAINKINKGEIILIESKKGKTS
jgi:predicted nuclease of predicted toxin-antitoxin system